MTAPAVRCRPVSLACLLLLVGAGTGTGAVANPAPLTLSQKPAVASGREPAPNVLLTIDDSGSMTSALGGGNSTRKIDLLKQSLRAVFGNGTANSGQIPDDRIRLAWQTLNGSVAGTGTLTAGTTNAMRSFGGAHRSNFESFVTALRAFGSTPTLAAMRRADDYARITGLHSPWADVPGRAQTTPNLTCRRMYHLLLTDGGWNSWSASDVVGVGQGDNASQTLGDGSTPYSITDDQTLVYRDPAGTSGAPSTVADFAFKSWANDLQPTMDNQVRKLIRRAGTETYATTACVAARNCKVTQEFWNPRNNPATWQHMTLFAIGFGDGAAGWNTGTGVPAPWSVNNLANDTFGGDLPRVIQGELSWPNVVSSGTYREIDMWHAAVNGRGRFFPVTTADGLTAAFAEIIGNVIEDTSQPASSIATNSGRLRAGTTAYVAGYTSGRFAGTLVARGVDATSGQIAADTLWNAAARLDALTDSEIASRVVLSARAADPLPQPEASVGIAYRLLADLPDAMRSPMNRTRTGVVDSKGQERIDHVRGIRTRERANGGIHRDRDSRLGSIVNSPVWYTGRPSGGSGDGSSDHAAFASIHAARSPMLYVGANDGMLHGFDAATGTERIAYIPRGIAEGPLRELTDPEHVHRYMVDGPVFTGDAKVLLASASTPQWRTVLVGAPGAGHRGYFILDVTDPGAFTVANAGALVLADRTATGDPDIGHIVSPAATDDAAAARSQQIAKLNDGRWAVVMGNGVNSANEAPVLLVQYLDGGRELLKLSPCGQPVRVDCAFKDGNGLATPRLVDLNGDGVPDVAYAGDLRGHLWKFDLGGRRTTSASAWRVAFDTKPLFVARRAGVAQPITAAPYVVPHPAGGLMVVVGTGRNLTDADRDSMDVQSLYGLWDPSTHAPAAGGGLVIADAAVINTPASPSLDRLVRQTYGATPVTDGDVPYSASTRNAVNYASVDAAGNRLVRGWVLDWPVPGQRVLDAARAFAGQKILVASLIPSRALGTESESCEVSTTAERRFTSVLNAFTGGVPATSPFDVSASIADRALLTMIEGGPGPSALVRTDDKVKLLPGRCPRGQTCGARDLSPGQTVGVRASWRRILP